MTIADRIIRTLEQTLDADGLTWEELVDEAQTTRPCLRMNLPNVRARLAEAGYVIPTPTAANGYRYRLTSTWVNPDDTAEGIRAGLEAIKGQALPRLLRMLSDVEVGIGRLDGRTLAGKEAQTIRRACVVASGALELAFDAMGNEDA